MNYTIRGVSSFPELRANVEYNLGFKNTDAQIRHSGFLPWLMTFRNASTVTTFESIFSELILIFEGGTFTYPGVKIGRCHWIHLYLRSTVFFLSLNVMR